MAKQTLIWTALPNGYTSDGKLLRLSVMMSPRLGLDSGDDQQALLSLFPDWLDWPSVLRSAIFKVTFNGETSTIKNYSTKGSNRIDGQLGLADSDIWKAVFYENLPVSPYRYKNLSSNVILSYDTIAIARKIKDLYRNLARTANGNMPLVSEFLNNTGWKDLVDTISTLDSKYTDEKTGLRDPAAQFKAFKPVPLPKIMSGSLPDSPLIIIPESDTTTSPQPESHDLENFDHFQLFHTPSGNQNPIPKQPRKDDKRIEHHWMEYNRQELPNKENLAKQLDFHQIVATMGSYPTLLRKLGLVVDLLLEPGKFKPIDNGKLSVEVTFPEKILIIPPEKVSLVVTRALLSHDKFQVISEKADVQDFQIENGLLKLEPNKFELLQMDVDGAGLKVMNFARSLGRRRNVNIRDSQASEHEDKRVNPVTLHEDEIGAPSLRTGGLMLVHCQRKTALENRFNRNSQLSENPKGSTLFANDVVRGYRIDIWDSTSKRWHSLCQRRANYLLGGGVEVPKDANSIEVTVNSEETTIRLAATKSADPNSEINDFLYLHEIMTSWTGWSLAAPPPGRVLSPDDSVDKKQLQSEAQIPPGLKFKSIFKPDPNSLPRLRFGRSYWIRARAVDLAGNSLAPQSTNFGSEDPGSLAIPYLRYEPVAAPIIALLSQNGTTEKPTEGESMTCIAVRSFNNTTAGNTVPSKQIAHRAVVPPQVSIREAEQHGKFDSSDGKVNSKTFDLLANQKDIDSSDPKAAVREVKIATPRSLESNQVDTTYAVYERGHKLTYLPDPLALEVAVFVFDHPNISDDHIITIPLYPTEEDWPEAQPFVLEVYEDPAQTPYFDAKQRVLRIPLPKGVSAKIRMSMKLASDDLDKMAIFALLDDADKTLKRNIALSGKHWMLTPWKVVEVVHAVQRPLIAPEMRLLTIEYDKRKLGSTSARPIIETSCSVRSTDRLDLFGEWHEPVDDVDLPESAGGPADRMRRDIAFSVKITDRKHYGGFPDHTIKDQDVIGINNIDDGGSTVKTHEFHDTRYRRIEYWFDATTRFREYLPNNLLTAWEGGKRVPVESNIKVTGPRKVTWVENSAPPPAPKVLYIVPTFGWIRTKDSEDRQSSWRRGGGLRVYLDRPWNASGYGEMLGVVLPPASFTGNPDNQPKAYPYKKYITQWGNDPIWDSPFVSGIAPTRSNFPLARYAPDANGNWLPQEAPETEKDQKPGPFKVTGLRPPSFPNDIDAEIEVAPHDVFYDTERQLWYCDIEIEAGASYFPFVRMALARYQPISITGAHLSNIVLADFMALTVDRWLVVMPTTTDTVRYQVAVFGIGFTESSAHHEATSMSVSNALTGQPDVLTPATVAERNIIEVWVEKLDSRMGEDFGWQRVADVTVSPKPPKDAGLTSLSESSAQTILSGSMSAVDRQKAQELLAVRDFENLARDHLIDVIRSWQMLWEGDVVLPVPPNDCDRYRLVIAEYEEYLIDDDRPYDKVPTRKDRRLVFVEHVELL